LAVSLLQGFNLSVEAMLLAKAVTLLQGLAVRWSVMITVTLLQGFTVRVLGEVLAMMRMVSLHQVFLVRMTVRKLAVMSLEKGLDGWGDCRDGCDEG
jgi:hypothetical protein